MNKKTYIKHQYFSVLIAYRSRNHTPSVQWFFWEGFRPQLVYQNVTIVTIRCIPLIAVPIGSMGLVYLPTNLASKIMVNISYIHGYYGVWVSYEVSLFHCSLPPKKCDNKLKIMGWRWKWEKPMQVLHWRGELWPLSSNGRSLDSMFGRRSWGSAWCVESHIYVHSYKL